MAGGKRAPKEKTKPSRKRTTIDLEMKIRIIRKYEGGQSLTAISRELGFAVSTVNTIVKDAARIKEHVKGTAMLKSTIITMKREGAISEMEKLLTMWMEAQIQKHVPLSLMTIQAKARNLFENAKRKYPEGVQAFAASSGWFSRFKERSGFHNVKVFGEPASGNVEGANKLPEWLQKVICEGPYLPDLFKLNLCLK
jgi:transposase-like protein